MVARARRVRPARRRRCRRRPELVPGRGVDAGVRRIGAHQLRCAPRARRRSSTWRPRRAAPRHRRRPATARLRLLGVRVQGPGQHGPLPSRPDRLRADLLGTLRARHGADVRAHRQAVRHEVRLDRVRRRAHHRRRGLPGRRRRARQRHRAQHRRLAVRGRSGAVPTDPALLARGVRLGAAARHRQATSSSVVGSPSSTRRASSRSCAIPTWATATRCWPPSVSSSSTCSPTASTSSSTSRSRS